MVGILIDNEKIFKNLEILSKRKNSNICQIEDNNEFDLKIKYSVSNGNQYMNMILLQQLINEGCNLILYISEMKEIPQICNIIKVNYEKELIPEEPNLIRLNDEWILPIEIELRFNNRDLGLIYTGVALDIQLLIIKIPKENQVFQYNLLNKILSEKLNAILISEARMYRENSGIIDLGLAILDSFDRVSDSLIYYAKMNNNLENNRKEK